MVVDKGSMIMEKIEDQVNFLLEIDKLKHIMRRTKLFDGSRYENDVEHSWHLAMMALVLAEHAKDRVDVCKVMKMALIHDIVEIDAGDYFFYNEVGSDDKKVAEERAAERIFGMLPESQAREMTALWEEFEERRTAEAKFAAALDRFEPLMQNYLTHGYTWRKYGITKAEVLRRNIPILANGAPALKSFMDRILDDASQKGYFPGDEETTGDAGVNVTEYDDTRDRQQTIALWKEVFGYTQARNEPALAIDKKTAANDGLFFVALDGQTVAGTIMAGYDGHRGWIYHLAVLPQHRNSGIGTALLHHAENKLARAGCMKINLQILEENRDVEAFYTANGYSPEKRISMGKALLKD
jgi:putative hydrolases of HD superfamily